MAQFAISDIHGCAKTFEALLNEIQLSPSDELFLLGDYIDRGPDSKGVIDKILALQKEGYQVKCLMGNHEEMLLESMDPEYGMINLWLRNGGKATLHSFSLPDHANPMHIPKPYLDFMFRLHRYFEVGPYLLVHAGLNFEAPEPLQDQDSMLWIRHYYQNINYDWLDGRILVHGHTPQSTGAVELQLQTLSEKQVIDIDTGCVFNKPGRDSLCAFNLTDQTLTFIRNQEADL
jgi:serine/threonine protein phosphatase 1